MNQSITDKELLNLLDERLKAKGYRHPDDRDYLFYHEVADILDSDRVPESSREDKRLVRGEVNDTLLDIEKIIADHGTIRRNEWMASILQDIPRLQEKDLKQVQLSYNGVPMETTLDAVLHSFTMLTTLRMSQFVHSFLEREET